MTGKIKKEFRYDKRDRERERERQRDRERRYSENMCLRAHTCALSIIPYHMDTQRDRYKRSDRRVCVLEREREREREREVILYIQIRKHVHREYLVGPRHTASVSGNTECLGMNPKKKEVQSVAQRFTKHR